MINVHYNATQPLPNLILVDTDRGVAAYAEIRYITLNYEYITSDNLGWPIDDEVGDYICSYDDLQQLHPEFFI